jgi:ADP-ribose pyrophosphatase YjhB (NUDIX family)
MIMILLLAQEKGRSLPDGWPEIYLSSAESILKEIEEETGFTCEFVKWISVFDKSKHNALLKK